MFARHKGEIVGIIIMTITGAAVAESAHPDIERVTHDDTVMLTNGAVDVGVSAKVGRVVHFGRSGGRNLMWASPVADAANAVAKDQWVNYGGDKVWPALQAIWPRFVPSGGGWPPDRIIDGQPWSFVERGERHIIIESRVNPDLQAKVVRRIELHESRPIAVITNRIERVGASVLPVLIWTVSQVHHPDYTLMAVAADRPANEADRPWLLFGNKKDIDARIVVLGDPAHAVRFNVTRDHSLKAGTLGPWVAGVWPDVIFAQYCAFDPAGSYPDRSSSQVYCDKNYVELELLSPQQHLQPGESMQLVVTWHLLDVPAEGIEDAEAIATQIDAAGT